MSRGSFNVAELLRQLGLKSARDLPVLETVQPVLPVGDASGLSPSLIAPIAWAGGEVAAVAGQYGAFQVSGRGAGGTWIRQFTTSAPGTSGLWRLNVSSTDPLAGGIATALPLLDMAANPVQSVVRKGTSATLLPAATTPSWNQIAATTFTMIDPVYLLPGSILTIEQATVNAVFYFSVIVQDVPAAPLSPTG